MKPTFKEKQKTLFKRAKLLRELATPAELAFEKKLIELDIYYKFQKCFIAKDFYCIVDFYLPKPYKLCIEIDGEYHNDPEQQKKDWAKDRYLTEVRNFKVLRLTNEQAINMSIAELSTLI